MSIGGRRKTKHINKSNFKIFQLILCQTNSKRKKTNQKRISNPKKHRERERDEKCYL